MSETVRLDYADGSLSKEGADFFKERHLRLVEPLGDDRLDNVTTTDEERAKAARYTNGYDTPYGTIKEMRLGVPGNPTETGLRVAKALADAHEYMRRRNTDNSW